MAKRKASSDLLNPSTVRKNLLAANDDIGTIGSIFRKAQDYLNLKQFVNQSSQPDGKTLLMQAAYMGHKHLMTACLCLGADHAQTISGRYNAHSFFVQYKNMFPCSYSCPTQTMEANLKGVGNKQIWTRNRHRDFSLPFQQASVVICLLEWCPDIKEKIIAQVAVMWHAEDTSINDTMLRVKMWVHVNSNIYQ